MIAMLCVHISALTVPTHQMSQVDSKQGSSTTVRSTSSSSNSGSSIAGDFIFGVILICLAFPILWNNERKMVRIAQLIKKARQQCVSINFREPKIEDNYKLVHASGTTLNRELIIDGDFDVEAENSIRLIRSVQMFQWVESSRKENDRVIYDYRKDWIGHLVSSDSFQDS